jgi:DNA-3-methyladenine glycosylase
MAWCDRVEAVRLLTGTPSAVAPRLLGAELTSGAGDGRVSVRITEVEAYEGESDPGSHAGRGRTRRNEVMYGRAGLLYCYLSHGLHYCLNVVTSPTGTAGAVLLRAGEVVAGQGVARQRRPAATRSADLARGPGRLGAALGLTLDDYGTDLLDPRSDTRLLIRTRPIPSTEISTGPRVGLRLAADRPWRFWLTGDPSVSAYRPAPARMRPSEGKVAGVPIASPAC